MKNCDNSKLSMNFICAGSGIRTRKPSAWKAAALPIGATPALRAFVFIDQIYLIAYWIANPSRNSRI